MYAEAFNTWKEKFRAECMAEGIAEGRAEGKAMAIAERKLNSLESCRKLYRTL